MVQVSAAEHTLQLAEQASQAEVEFTKKPVLHSLAEQAVEEVQTLHSDGQASQFPLLMTNKVSHSVQVVVSEQTLQLAGQALQDKAVII